MNFCVEWAEFFSLSKFSNAVLIALRSQIVESVEQRDFEENSEIWPPCSDWNSLQNLQQKPRKILFCVFMHPERAPKKHHLPTLRSFQENWNLTRKLDGRDHQDHTKTLEILVLSGKISNQLPFFHSLVARQSS